MNEAPEGLDYGKPMPAKANKLEQYLEAGKYETGREPNPEHEKAETLRMLHSGSHDPMYKDKHKNK